MDIRSEILREHSKQNALRIADFVGDDPGKFALLMDLFLGSEYRVTQRAAQIVKFCALKHAKLIDPYMQQMIQNLHKKVHVAVKRNTLRILQDMSLPEELLGDATEVCFNLFRSHAEPIAVKVFAMTVLANICEKEPELSRELQILIEDQMPYSSAGFKSRAGKILKKLHAIPLN